MRGAGVDTSRAEAGVSRPKLGWVAALALAAVVVMATTAPSASGAVDRGTGRLADVHATITPGGAPVTVTTGVDENAYVTFTGAIGMRVMLKIEMNMSSGAAEVVNLLDPDNARIRGTGAVGNGTRFIDPPEEIKFAAPRTYTIEVDPMGNATGSNTLTLYDVPPDITGSIVPGGPDVTVTTTAPGQDARLKFYAHKGELIRVTRTAATIPFSIFRILDPRGDSISSNGLVGPQTVPPLEPSEQWMTESGFYTVLMDGYTDNVGSSTFRLERRAPFQPPDQTIGSCDGRYLDTKAACGTRSDPVNTLTGAFTYEVGDVALPGNGIPFSFTRWYDSSDTTVGRLGQGWTDSLAASLAVESNGDVVLHSENGQRSRFYRQADGSFRGVAGAQSTLAEVQGGWELTRHDATKLRFDGQGRLIAMKDRNDQGLTLAYGGDGKLATVTDAANRQVTFTHNADGRLTQIAVPGSQTVTFGYAAGRLTSATDLAGQTTGYRYDASGRLDQITDPRNNLAIRNTYGADGRVTEQLDALGNRTTFAWDATTQTATVTDARNNVWKDFYANNVLLKRIDAGNNVTEFAHNVALDETSVKAPDGQQTTMTYDSRGNMLTATAPPSLANAQKTFVYNARNDVTQVTDARGKVTTYGYDANGNNTTVVQDGQTIVTNAYNGSGQLTSSTDGANRTTTYTYDANGNRASETDALGNKKTFGYDAKGRITSMVEPRGNAEGADPNLYRTTYTYDGAGRLLTETNALGQVMTYAYDAAGNRTSVTDANNKTTTYAYDAANRVLTKTAPDTGVTTYTYDVVGNTLTERNPSNQTTTFTYDVNNRLASVTTPLGNKTTHFYDANGNLVREVEPRGNVAGANPDDYDTVHTYDAAGRLLTETDPLGNTTTYGYDAVGNRSSVRDARNHTTTYTYDGRNRLQSVTAPGGAATTYAYDGASNLLSRTDPNSHVTSYGYDAANRLVSKTLPLNRVWTYAYDDAGNLVSTVDAKGNATQTSGDGTTTQTWDRAGRLTAINYSDATPDVTFAYDAVANRTQMTDGAGSEIYTYDSVNRLKTVTRGSDTFSYDYDLAGRLTRRTYPDSTVTDYTYDADSRLATAASSGQTTTYAYDPAGNLLSTTLPAGNGHVEERTYDSAGRLTRVKTVKGGATLVDFAYTLDPVGNPTEAVRAGSAAGTTTYAYDARDRLTEVCFQASCPGGGDPFIRWTYDGVGNRLTESRPTGTTNYTYNDADELVQAGSTTYTYDANGNQTAAGSTTMTYDLANRMKTHAAGNTTTTYSYDGVGVRRQASTGSQASKKTNFVWDVNHGLPQLALERDGNSALLRRYAYGQRRISMTSAGSASYYHYDSLGSVANLTSPTGATQWTWAYEPFGSNRTEIKASGTQPTNYMKFAGEYLDPTLLYNLRERQYDPSSGRFLQVDRAHSLGTEAASSAYAYAANRPTSLVDPSGRRGIPSSLATVAAHTASSSAFDTGWRVLFRVFGGFYVATGEFRAKVPGSRSTAPSPIDGRLNRDGAFALSAGLLTIHDDQGLDHMIRYGATQNGHPYPGASARINDTVGVNTPYGGTRVDRTMNIGFGKERSSGETNVVGWSGALRAGVSWALRITTTPRRTKSGAPNAAQYSFIPVVFATLTADYWWRPYDPDGEPPRGRGEAPRGFPGPR